MLGRRLCLVLLMAFSLAAASSPARAADYVWWEGEDAYQHNFSGEPFAPGTLDHPEELSGGQWLNTGGEQVGPEVFARWHVRVPASGAYHLYARKFWHHGPFRWRFGDGPWRRVERVALIDSVELKKFIVANWVSLGQVELEAGAHVFEIRLLAGPGESTAAAFDCFVLTREPFMPSGKLRPGQKSGKAMPGYWAFEPDVDTFAESPIDLRYLNDETAGDRGFLKARGLDFVFEDEGRPVRFWGVCCGSNTVDMDRAQVDYVARKLAKGGVNMIRVHSGIFDPASPDPAAVDERYVASLHYFVAAMKREGIYTHLSIYFPLWFHVKPSYGLPGFEGIENDIPFALLFFHPRMQEIYKAWVTALMSTVNPNTGLSLADDPAVGVFEIINEDNYFFWTFSPGRNIPYECIALLEERFAGWAARRYGSQKAALDAWGFENERDAPDEGRLGLMQVWHLTRDALRQMPASRKRAADQARFLTEELRAFYEGMHGWLRDEIGVKCPIVATNWTTADPALLGALDKYTNAACEVMDRHAYTGAPHETDRGYAVTAGDRYQDRCFLLHPGEVAVRELQYDGHPHIVTEYAFPMINRYRNEAAVLGAVYGALQGTDGLFFFALGGPGWRGQLGKWPVMVPSVYGQFPAAALIYRRGDVAEAQTVVHQVLSLEDLYALEGSGTSEPQAIDGMRAGEVPPGGRATGVRVSNIDPLAYYVGRVLRSFSGDAAHAVMTDMSPYIDRERKKIRSIDGQASWDYGAGYATVNTPRAQGATGLLRKAGRIETDDVAIDMGSEYASVLVTALDEAPIGSARKLLVQVMTEETNFGWQDAHEGEMKRVVSLGTPPLNVRLAEGTVLIRRPDVGRLSVTALDPNGYPLDRRVRARLSGEGLAIELLPDVLYYVVQAQ